MQALRCWGDVGRLTSCPAAAATTAGDAGPQFWCSRFESGLRASHCSGVEDEGRGHRKTEDEIRGVRGIFVTEREESHPDL